MVSFHLSTAVTIKANDLVVGSPPSDHSMLRQCLSRTFVAGEDGTMISDDHTQVHMLQCDNVDWKLDFSTAMGMSFCGAEQTWKLVETRVSDEPVGRSRRRGGGRRVRMRYRP